MNLDVLNLAHTPGICYAAAYFLSTQVIMAVNRKRLTGWRYLLASAVFLFVIVVFMVTTDGVTGFGFFISMLSIFSMIFFFILITGEMGWKKALYFSIRSFILGEFAASFEWQMYFFSVDRNLLPPRLWIAILFFLIFQGLLFLIIWFLEKRYRSLNTELTINWRDLIIIILLSGIIYAISNISFAFPDSPFSGHYSFEIFAMRTLTDLAGVVLLYGYHLQRCESRASMEKEYLERLLHLQEENYRISAESIQLVNQKYHDLKHQISLLRSEVSAAEKLQYLDEMEQEIKSYEAQNKTGNQILDVLLTAKSLQCQNEGISMTCVADGEALSFIKPTDLSVLFGNVLDNAIEGVSAIEDPEKRLIHLSVAKQRGFVRIREENCFEGNLKIVDGLPATTKKDSRYHGYGIKSIQTIVQKYNGSMTVKSENGWFELRILIPLRETRS